MTTAQQNRNWARITPDFRSKVREMHSGTENVPGYELMALTLMELFGYHNLTSNNEPEEMLMVERKTIIEHYELNESVLSTDPTNNIALGIKSVLYGLFGDKCLPDKEEQAKPKFEKGQKVIVNGKFVSEIKDIDTKGYPDYPYIIPKENGKMGYFAESDLEPYTEEKNDMEEKELNLCVLLKGCEGEKLYSLAYGICLLDRIIPNNNNGSQPLISVKLEDGTTRNFTSHGTTAWGVDWFAPISLYPYSLYEKYPRDAKKAWGEWAESRKPKRWRAKDGEYYWWINPLDFQVFRGREENDKVDDRRYNAGLYFRTKELAEEAAEEVRKTLESFHKRKEGEK